jgi:hypothetical protein
MLINRQNSHAPRNKRRTGRREAQSRGSGEQSKNTPCIIILQGTPGQGESDKTEVIIHIVHCKLQHLQNIPSVLFYLNDSSNQAVF